MKEAHTISPKNSFFETKAGWYGIWYIIWYISFVSLTPFTSFTNFVLLQRSSEHSNYLPHSALVGLEWPQKNLANRS